MTHIFKQETTSRLLTFFMLFVLILLLNVGCSEEQVTTPKKTGRPQTSVRVAEVMKQAVRQSVRLIGTVEPWKRSTIASEIEGIVEIFPVEEGMAVKEGQLLGKLRTDIWHIQLDSAFASYREAKTRYLQAKRDLLRLRVLFEQGLVTQKEFDDGKAQANALRERGSQLDAEIRRVQNRLTKSEIVAPFDGWITREFTEIGQWVKEGGGIVEIVDLSHVQVEVPLPERYVSYISIGDPVKTTFDGLPSFQAEGKVFSVIAQADRVARTFPVKIDIPNPRLFIKSGMVSRVTLQMGQLHEGLVIPKDALVLHGEQESVFMVKEDKAVQVPVTSVTHFNEMVEVQGEIQEGMEVVVEGNERLFPGQPIRILNDLSAENIP